MAGLRPTIVRVMRDMRVDLQRQIGNWGAPSLTWYADEPGGEAHWHNEKRARSDIRPEEYPENSPAYLRRLIKIMAEIARAADAIAAAAQNRLAELEREANK